MAKRWAASQTTDVGTYINYEESVEHYFWHCPARIAIHYRFLGNVFFDCLAEFVSVDIISHQNFIKLTKWSEHLER